MNWLFGGLIVCALMWLVFANLDYFYPLTDHPPCRVSTINHACQ
jgi:hypothetical protein